MKGGVWTIVLAAGSGRRLASMTGGVPKQFWRPPGGHPSLLGATLARLRPLSTPDRTVTIVDERHRPYVAQATPAEAVGRILFQPMDRGTAAGVLLPLVTIAAAADDPIVIVTPSDHGVADARGFRSGLSRAVAAVRDGLSEIVLFGVEATSPRTDYGWITPSGPATDRGGLTRVKGFVEKPHPERAADLLNGGAVWNTMVLVARTSALLDRFERHLPTLTAILRQAAGLDESSRERYLELSYPSLPAADFSRDLVTPSANLCLYVWPHHIGWSDLGTPERLSDWLLRQDAEPAEAAPPAREAPAVPLAAAASW